MPRPSPKPSGRDAVASMPPLPLTVSVKRNTRGNLEIVQGYGIVAELPDKEDAALIVKAVNSHAALVQALQAISGWSKCQCRATHGDNLNCPVLIAEKALKLAGQEE